MSPVLRGSWLYGTVLLTLACYAVTIAFAPAAGHPPAAALGTLLFLGTSVHVASTAWFWTVGAVRRHMLASPGRYLVAPAVLVAGSALLAAALPAAAFGWVLPGFLAWQFFHFQKQNLGLAALAATSYGAGGLSRSERRAVTGAGLAGIVGLLARPGLLQLGVDPRLEPLRPFAAAGYGLCVLAGLALLVRRPRGRRPVPFVLVQLLCLLFFLPAFCFDSPYAAVAGLTAAHGYQYLVIMGLVAAGGRRAGLDRLLSLALLLNIALLLGTGLNLASHLHGASAPGGRALYGGYLGLVAAHFVVDAGLWRLRDAFPRAFLADRLPYLVPHPRPSQPTGRPGDPTAGTPVPAGGRGD
ncbi:hypothetical protein [Kitasatospora nipponensis]